MQETQRTTTSTEFLKWIAYLDRIETRRTKMDWYFALIACEVRRSQSTKPNTIQVEDFLLEFTGQDDPPIQNLSVEERTARSKAFWCGITQTQKE